MGLISHLTSHFHKPLNPSQCVFGSICFEKLEENGCLYKVCHFTLVKIKPSLVASYKYLQGLKSLVNLFTDTVDVCV